VPPIFRRVPAVAPPRRHLERAAATMVTEPPGIDFAYEIVDWAPTDSGAIMALIGAMVATGVGLRIAFVAPRVRYRAIIATVFSCSA